jgi:hypothetical protein
VSEWSTIEISIPLPIVHHDPKRAKLIVFDPTGLWVGTGLFRSESKICTLVADGFDEEDVQETIWTSADPAGKPTKGHVLWLDRRAELALVDWLDDVTGGMEVTFAAELRSYFTRGIRARAEVIAELVKDHINWPPVTSPEGIE